MEHDRISSMTQRLTEEIGAHSPLLLDEFPISRYIQQLDDYPEVCDYNYISAKTKAYSNKVIKSSNKEVLELYHQLVLVTLVLRSNEKLERSTLPQEIKILYENNFERILSKIESKGEGPGFYLYPNDKFHKDLGVCSQKIIPLGVGKINICKVPKKFIIKGGLKQFIDGLSMICVGFDGFKPVYEVHIDSHDPDYMAEFNPVGWLKFLKLVAHMMKMDNRIAGGYGVAWFLDPELETVSPRLTYIRKVVIDNGGKLFNMGTNESATKDALTKSPTRRKLYMEGKYIPTNYMVFWPRKSLINWVDNLT